MRRYTTRAAAAKLAALYYDESGAPSITADIVFETEPEGNVDIGIVDQYGNNIFRINEREPIGFHLQPSPQWIGFDY